MFVQLHRQRRPSVHIPLTSLVGDLVIGSSLNLGSDSDQLLSQCVLGRGVDHLLSDGRIIGRPTRWRDRVSTSIHPNGVSGFHGSAALQELTT